MDFVGRNELIVTETVGALIAVVQQQRSLVPRVERFRLGLRHGNWALISRLNTGVAADMVAVAMGIDQFRQRCVAESLFGREQGQG